MLEIKVQSLPGEQWKEIQGFGGRYAVSTAGRVYSGFVGDILTGGVVRGYRTVNLSKNGQTTTYYVHRLVAAAFIPNPDNLPIVNHIDENKTNNNVENLEWVTYQENTLHSLNNCKKQEGQKKRGRKGKKVNQYTKEGVFIQSWNSGTEAAKALNIPQSSISLCCKGKYGSAGGFIWQYADAEKSE